MSADREPLCPFCGAYSSRSCDLLDETGGTCPWDELTDDDRAEIAEREDDREQAWREGRR